MTDNTLNQGIKQKKKPLSLKEKAEAYVLWTKDYSITQIAKRLGQNYYTMRYFINNSAKQNKLEPKHNLKGRFKKGSSKVTQAHKKFIEKWLRSGKVHSSREIWRKLNLIQKVSKIGLTSVPNYVKTLGKWVVPSLREGISARNREKRLLYCQKIETQISPIFYLLMSAT